MNPFDKKFESNVDISFKLEDYLCNSERKYFSSELNLPLPIVPEKNSNESFSNVANSIAQIRIKGIKLAVAKEEVYIPRFRNEIKQISQMLKNFGFPLLSEKSKKVEIINCLQEVLNKYQVINEEKVHNKAEKLDEITSQVFAAEERVKQLKHEHCIELTTKNNEIEKLRIQNVNLQQKFIHLENLCNTKDSQIDELKRKYDFIVTKQEKQDQESRKLFQSFVNRAARPNGTVPDTKLLNMISILDTQRKEQESDIASLRKEVQVLNRSVINAVKSASSSHLQSDEQLKQRLERYESQVQELLKEIQEIKQDKDELLMELETRPSSSDWTLAQQKIKELEEKMHVSIIGPKDARKKIKEDKKDFKLQLFKVDELPEAVCKLLLKDICRELKMNDLSLLVSEIQKINIGFQKLSNLEKFATTVCEFISQQRKDAPIQLENVLPALKCWVLDLRNLGVLQNMKESIIKELKKRAQNEREGNQWPEFKIIQQIKNLVELEELGNFTNNVINGLREELQNGNSSSSSKIILHFQKLFEVKTIEGILPKMNQLYISSEEKKNAAKALQSVLIHPMK